MADSKEPVSLSTRLDALDVVLSLVGLYGAVAVLMALNVEWIPVKAGFLGAVAGPTLRRAVGIPLRPAPKPGSVLGPLASLSTLLGIILAVLGGLFVAPALTAAPDFPAQVAKERAGQPLFSFAVSGEDEATKEARLKAAQEDAAARAKDEAAKRLREFEDGRGTTLRQGGPYLLAGVLLIVAWEAMTRARLRREGHI